MPGQPSAGLHPVMRTYLLSAVVPGSWGGSGDLARPCLKMMRGCVVEGGKTNTSTLDELERATNCGRSSDRPAAHSAVKDGGQTCGGFDSHHCESGKTAKEMQWRRSA